MIRHTMSAALFIGALLTITGGVNGQAATGRKAPERSIFVDMQADGSVREPAIAALARKAAQRGQVRVIVGLRNAPAVADNPAEPEEEQQIQALTAAQSALAARIGVSAGDTVTFDYIPFVSLWVNAAQLARLVADPNVSSIQEDVPGTGGLDESVPLIRANKLWKQGFEGNGWTVAILDTGVDKDHPMLKNKVVSEACYSTNNSGQGVSSLCPGGKTSSTASGSGLYCKPANFGSCYHGTHVAGIAAGHKPALDGVARGADIIAIQVFSKQGNQTVTFDTDWVKGLNRVYALRNKYKISAINMSLGFGQFTGPCDAQVPAALSIIKKLRAVDIATIVASMNDSFDGDMRAPACVSAAIAVGSTTKQDAISDFSNHALQVRHMAPGSDIRSAKPGGGYQVLSGTSMATPHVVGAYTLLRDVRAGSTVDDISAALECTGKPVTRNGVTERRIDLVKAKDYLLNPPKTKTSFGFTDATEASQWGAPLGGWAVNGGHMQITEGSAGWKVVVTANCNESMIITSRMIRLWATGQSGANGILFKSQFRIVGGAVNVGGYIAVYNRNNSVSLLRFDGYNMATDSGLFKTLCSATVAINDNDYNLMRVDTRGGVHEIFLNDQFACKATDYTYGTGVAGVAMFIQALSAQNGYGADTFVITPKETVPKKLKDDGDEIPVAESASGVRVPPVASAIGRVGAN